MKLTNEDVQDILRLLDATKYDELHIETEHFKLTLRRNPETGDWSRESKIFSKPNLVLAQVAASPIAAEPAKAQSPPDARTHAGLAEVRAHLPGTFYRAPKPGAPPFVEVGSHVENDTVVGIIETMKLMNAVHAETQGEVAEICQENARFAEKDAVLMRIKAGAA